MAGFPTNNSLYSPNQLYRLSDDTPFGERSLVVASDDQWRYVSVRRLAVFVERSMSSSVQSAAFEPNGPALWARVNSEVTEFLSGLFRRGELKGDRPSQAYFVKCGVETMTEGDVDNGDLNVVVGFAPQKPAEFVIVAIAATAGPPALDLPRMPHDPPWRWIWARWDE
jgi:Bacteriophage tail sheath protein